MVKSFNRIGREWVVMAVIALGATTAQARNVALLIGVGDYGSANLNLEGPPHDVAELRSVLQRRWGFASTDVRTLVNAQATRSGILDELRALQTRSAPGDDVLIYFSGHGTSALDGTARLPVPHGSGAFVPSGVGLPNAQRLYESVIEGRRDLRQLIEELDRGGRRVMVISDTCYSGNQVRSVADTTAAALLKPRMIPLVVSGPDAARRSRDEAQLAGRPASIDPYPYRSTAYIAAAAEGEVARDIPQRALIQFPTRSGRPHGALTDALLRVLEGDIAADVDRDGRLSVNELHRALSDFMALRAYGHTPQRLPAVTEDQHGLGSRSALAATGVSPAPSARDAPSPLRLRVAPGMAPATLRVLEAVPHLALVHDAHTSAELALRRPADGRVQLTSAAGDLLGEWPVADTERLQRQVHQLAWAQQLRQLAERHRRTTLAWDIYPEAQGGNFRIGQTLHFVARPDREAWLLLLNIDSSGLVSVLYPYTRAELRSLPAGDAHAIPGRAPHQQIVVKGPLGMDTQFAFAFDAPPAGLDRLVGLTDVAAGDARLAVLNALLEASSGRFAFAQTWMRTAAAK